jgi:hypothetical protein
MPVRHAGKYGAATLPQDFDQRAQVGLSARRISCLNLSEQPTASAKLGSMVALESLSWLQFIGK